MERTEFVEGEPGSWWFIDPANDTRWYPARRELAESRGWEDPYWLTEPAKLEELYRDLDSKAPQLLRELDNLREDDDERIAWIRLVLEALAEPVPAASAETSHDPEPATAVAPPAHPAQEEPAAAAARQNRSGGGLFASKAADDAPSAPAQDAPPEGVPAHVTEGVARVLQALSGESASDLAAELGLTEADLAELAGDPEFERMVHEEAARLHLGQTNA
ncbi:MAG TPA: hypothetical protein VFH70_09580 [Acidimicrobiales bacterium]|nr:hypothetical protein [Acidimicrobiales bacterium]